MTRRETSNVIKYIRWPSAETANINCDYIRWLCGHATNATSQGHMSVPHGAIFDLNTHANRLDLMTEVAVTSQPGVSYTSCFDYFDVRHIGFSVRGAGAVLIEVLSISALDVAIVVAARRVTLTDRSMVVTIDSQTKLIGRWLAVRITTLTDTILGPLCWIYIGEGETSASVDSDILTLWKLQGVLFPDVPRSDRADLYARWTNSPGNLSDSFGLPIQACSTVDLTTFFNAFSHRKWYDYTGLDDLRLRITGTGRVRCAIYAIIDSGDETCIASDISDLSYGPLMFALGNPGQLSGEILGLRVTALSDGVKVTGADWLTTVAPKRKVNLGVIITTFQRERAAVDAAQLFAETIIPGAPSDGSIELFIIDNGSSIPDFNLPGVRKVTNINLGGAGGFTRGIIELRASGTFTHALFMDDDASCEPESVWRTMTFLSRARNPELAIAGAMLLTTNPTIQYEKGAILELGKHSKSLWSSPLANRDLRWQHIVASNEIDAGVNYGGWWFFCFYLKPETVLPFPFFVRGDDVDFAIINDIDVVTLNGVGSWCDPFFKKLTASTQYLAWRSWMALQFMHGHPSQDRRRLMFAIKQSLKCGIRFDYAGMEAILDGLSLSMKGPAAFGEKPAPIADLKRVNARDKTLKISSELIADMLPINNSRSFVKKVIAVVTLSGHLLPSFMLNKKPVYAKVAWDIGLTRALLTNFIVTGSDDYLEVRMRDRSRFILGALRIGVILLIGMTRITRVSHDYKNNAGKYRLFSYWKSALSLHNMTDTD